MSLGFGVVLNLQAGLIGTEKALTRGHRPLRYRRHDPQNLGAVEVTQEFLLSCYLARYNECCITGVCLWVITLLNAHLRDTGSQAVVGLETSISRSSLIPSLRTHPARRAREALTAHREPRQAGWGVSFSPLIRRKCSLLAVGLEDQEGGGMRERCR